MADEPNDGSAVLPATPQVVLGVTGSIAACKAADLASRMVQAGIDTHVVMTDSACRLVQPQTFLTLSRNRVTTSLWDVPEWRPQHIALSDSAAVLLIAPATANIIGKYAGGIADDALSTFALSFAGPVLLAPAMNPRMWRHPAVQANCRILRSRGVRIVDPAPGRVACGGETGPGRMASVETVFNALKATLAVLRNPLPAVPPKKILISAGPTREFLDPARYLTNRSSGKMGYALAEVALAAGHPVTLVSGPVDIAPPAGAEMVAVASAAEMAEAIRHRFTHCDILMMSAAVADYRPTVVSPAKFKKKDGPMLLEMERTEDILMALEERKSGQIIVGFAAETDHVEEYARGKLARKHLDWIAANDIGRGDIGFQADDNEVTLLGADGTVLPIPRAPKIDVAARILGAVLGG